MRRTAPASIVAVCMLFLAACGDDDPATTEDLSAGDVSTAPESSNSSGASPADNGAEQFVDYFEKIGTGQPSQLAQAAAMAAPNSVAYGYALNRLHINSVNLDYGFGDVNEKTVEIDDDTATLCPADGQGECSEFADLVTKGGKPASFTVNGLDLADRLVLGNGKRVSSKGIASFEFLSSYQAASDDALVAIFRLYSNGRTISASYVARYRTPDGRQVETLDSYLPDSLGPNSNQLGMVIFPNAEVGGDLILKWATRDNGPLVVEEVAIPTGKV